MAASGDVIQFIDDENEVFFGPISDKEREISNQIGRRKTIYVPTPRNVEVDDVEIIEEVTTLDDSIVEIEQGQLSEGNEIDNLVDDVDSLKISSEIKKLDTETQYEVRNNSVEKSKVLEEFGSPSISTYKNCGDYLEYITKARTQSLFASENGETGEKGNISDEKNNSQKEECILEIFDKQEESSQSLQTNIDKYQETEGEKCSKDKIVDKKEFIEGPVTEKIREIIELENTEERDASDSEEIVSNISDNEVKYDEQPAKNSFDVIKLIDEDGNENILETSCTSNKLIEQNEVKENFIIDDGNDLCSNSQSELNIEIQDSKGIFKIPEPVISNNKIDTIITYDRKKDTKSRESYYSSLNLIDVTDSSTDNFMPDIQDSGQFSDSSEKLLLESSSRTPAISITSSFNSTEAFHYSSENNSQNTYGSGNKAIICSEESLISCDDSCSRNLSTDEIKCNEDKSMVFNDTLEEIELFLKYGPDYDKIVNDPNFNKDANDTEMKTNKIVSNSDQNSNKGSIIQNVESTIPSTEVSLDFDFNNEERKRSISSIKSQESFHPVMNSANKAYSTENIDCVLDYDGMEAVSYEPDLVDVPVRKSPCMKKIDFGKGENCPPPKPPRKIISSLTPSNANVNKTFEKENVATSSSKTKLNLSNSQSKLKTPSKISPYYKNKFTPEVTPEVQTTLHTPRTVSSKKNSSLGTPNAKNSQYYTPQLPKSVRQKTLFAAPKTNLQKSQSLSKFPTPKSVIPTPKICKSPYASTKCAIPQKSTCITSNQGESKIISATTERRAHPSNHIKVPLTPGNSTNRITTPSPRLKKAPSRGRLNKPCLPIESPVAKYLQENPPPPFITIVKPKNKLSPDILKECRAQNKKPLTPRNILQENCSIDNNTIRPSPMPMKKCPLPQINYLPAKYYQVEELKENRDLRREIRTNKTPAVVIKHRGRMQIEKEALFDMEDLNVTSTTSVVEISMLESHEAPLGHRK